MKPRNLIKTIWKAMMRSLIKVYANNYQLHVRNTMETLAGKKYYSQFGQDLYVLDSIYKNKSDGFFVDIGANHPVNANNTYLLELNGWKGLAIEPQESLRSLWPNTRKTPCLNYVIGAENKEVSFIEANASEHGLSGVEGYNKCTTDCKKISVTQRRLEDILAEYSVTDVDFLSIDVEGYEMNVLNGIDFSKVNIKLICVENDIGFKSMPLIGKQLGEELGNKDLREFIISKGYKYIARIMSDDIFIKE